MGWLVRFAKSSIGAKLVMALTGVILLGFVIAHMVGNLQVFLGPDAINSYAAMLQSLGGALWLARLVLLGSVVLHIASGLRLVKLNREARPVGYVNDVTKKAGISSRTMAFSGLVLLAFLVYHLLHFTIVPESVAADAQGRHDVHTMMVTSFQHPAISFSYMFAMILLGMHLSHGASSLFQTLGLNHSKYNSLIEGIGPCLGIIIVVGNISMPALALIGVLKPGVGVF